MGSAPNDVKGSAELHYELDKTQGEQIRHNNEKWRNRVGRLRDAGAFRIPLPRDTWEKVNVDTGAGVTAFAKRMSKGGGLCAEGQYKTASGEFIDDYGGLGHERNR